MLRNERNFQFHFVFAILVTVFGFIFNISKIEWMFVLLCIFGVFALEMVNTAIEKVVDLVTSEHHPLAKHAKDIAAGAVLIYAIMTVIIGIIIFLPKVAHFISSFIN